MFLVVVFHRRKKIFGRAIGKFFLRKLLVFIIVTTSGKIIPKIKVFFFKVLFFLLPRAKFCCKVVLLHICTYIGTTKPVTLPVTPKHGASTVFISPVGCNPYGDLILLITLSILSPKVAKNEQNHFCTKL